MSHTLEDSPNSKINKSILKKYMDLPFPEGRCQAMYVWIDWYGFGLRGKTRTLDFIPENVEDCPVWILDAPQQYFKAEDEAADFYLTPVAMYRDPFRRGDHKLILCANYNKNSVPMSSNKRHACAKVMKAAKDFKPWFGLEQEYTLMDTDNRPLGWPKNGFPKIPDSPFHFFCGVGSGRAIAREVVEAHYRACMYAGINISGTNAEAVLGQWEFQVGPNEGIKVADDLWMARYILERITEEYGIGVTLDPKPVGDNFNGSGGHCNFSTWQMRAEGGIKEIEKACEKLSRCQAPHLKAYDSAGGKDNERRLIGAKETSKIDTFSSGVGNRGCSIRIPRAVANEGRGYLEDRRPAANCDPYLVCERMVRTVCLNEFE